MAVQRRRFWLSVLVCFFKMLVQLNGKLASRGWFGSLSGHEWFRRVEVSGDWMVGGGLHRQLAMQCS